MSLIWKGKQGVVLVREEPQFDAETGILQFEQTWVGSKAAVFGYANELQESGYSFRVSNDGPVYSVITRLPQNNPATENLDRWEIATQSVDKSIFEHDTIIAAAAAYDATLSANQDTFKKAVTDAADAQASFVADSVFGKCVRHLRAGVTGFQRDFITLRRFRQVDSAYAVGASGKFNIGDDSLIYSTAQLNVPQDVAFALPNTPSDPSEDFSWGWKRTGQRVEIVGINYEQTVELLFAPWSTLVYSASGGNLAW